MHAPAEPSRQAGRRPSTTGRQRSRSQRGCPSSGGLVESPLRSESARTESRLRRRAPSPLTDLQAAITWKCRSLPPTAPRRAGRIPAAIRLALAGHDRVRRTRAGGSDGSRRSAVDRWPRCRRGASATLVPSWRRDQCLRQWPGADRCHLWPGPPGVKAPSPEAHEAESLRLACPRRRTSRCSSRRPVNSRSAVNEPGRAARLTFEGRRAPRQCYYRRPRSAFAAERQIVGRTRTA